MRKVWPTGDGSPTSVGQDRLYKLESSVSRPVAKSMRHPLRASISERVLSALVHVIAFGGLAGIAVCIYRLLWEIATRQ